MNIRITKLNLLGIVLDLFEVLDLKGLDYHYENSCHIIWLRLGIDPVTLKISPFVKIPDIGEFWWRLHVSWY